MKSQQIIWHVSEGRKFPLDLRKTDALAFQVKEISPQEMKTLKPDPADLHVFLIQGERGGLAAMRNLVEATPHLSDFPRILILSQDQYGAYDQAHRNMNLMVIDDSVRPVHLKLIVEIVLRVEHYRQIVFHMSEQTREQAGLLERMLGLAREEIKNAREESGAFEALMEFETAHKRFERSISDAMERTMKLKDQELLELKGTLAAYERLSEFRDRELMEMRKHISATESALEFSHRENMEREKIIQALERLRLLTDKELIDLFQENQQLRGRLGMPPREFP